ncbi:regulatory P domain containing protein [Nitzschia inconspicua]|uniref:Regulatory P domain containing protein n=1 Tax=Nitzschia inconspicua TaxID=303405 RepID=A0A9K3KC59_9STRA|nr:regulatory P domain containing protein [Nitzschia inconspicua]
MFLLTRPTSANPEKGGLLGHPDDEEWKKYGCGAEEEVGMAACFCRFLRDAMVYEEVSSTGKGMVPLANTMNSSANCVGGWSQNFPCGHVDLLLHLQLTNFGSEKANDVWGWTHSASGRDFAILDVKTYKDHAFIGSEATNHGMQVFDLTELLTKSGTENFQETAHYNGVGNSHNIVINEASGNAYIVGSNKCSGGLHMVDFSNPPNPTEAGCYSGDGFIHDAHCVIYNGPDASYKGKEICFACNENAIVVVDVTNKKIPVQLHRQNQGWLSPDHQYFVFGDETDEMKNGDHTRTLVMNVQDLNNIQFAAAYVAQTTAVNHNLYIKDDIIYLASYRAGLRVLQVKNYQTASFEEVGYFDVHPGSDSASFNGAWSVYPFFSSGIVSIERGLFVVKPDNIDAPPPTPAPPTTPPTAFTCDRDKIEVPVQLLTDQWSDVENHFKIVDITLYDDYEGDGLTGNAYFKLVVGGTEEWNSDELGSNFTSASHEFSVGTTTAATSAPTPLPTHNPTKAPTAAPTQASSGSCQGGQSFIRFELNTDQWSKDDNHFEVIDMNTNQKTLSRIKGGYPMGAGNLVVDTMCLPAGRYKITVYDDWETDGLTGVGYFKFLVNGVVKWSDNDVTRIFKTASYEFSIGTTPISCPSGQKPVVFELLTDPWSYQDNSFEIVDSSTHQKNLSRG